MPIEGIKDLDFPELLKTVLKTAVDGIIMINNRGIILEINRAAMALFEYEEKEVVGKSINNLMPKNLAKEHDKYLSNYIETKIPKIIGIGREVVGLKKSGETFPFRLAVSEVILNDRIIFTGIIHDVSEIKKTQEELKQINDQLEQRVIDRTYEVESVVNKLLNTNAKLELEVKERMEAEAKLKTNEVILTEALSKEKELNDLKSKFVATASHEFRTPLSTILSSAALISKYKDDDGQSNRERHIGKIKNAVIHLTGILNDFLSLSKVEEGKVILDFQEFDLKTLCENVISDLRSILKNDQVLTLIPAPSINMVSDSKLIVKSLFNLISNGIKYSGGDGVIEIRLVKINDEVEISISDNGIGIPEEEQKFLFERFYRASNTTNIQGTGLGLNIVQKYIELLQGSINFKSKQGKGTTFTLRLPLDPKKNT